MADGVHLIENPHRTYFVSSVLFAGETLILVDAGRAESPETSIFPTIKALGRNPQEISLLILTHAHWDHCAGAAQIKRETGCDVAIHSKGETYLKNPETVARELATRFPGIPSGNVADFDAVEPEIVFQDGSKIALNGRELKIIHTPGHSPDSCCIIEPKLGLYIAGDSIQGRGERRPLIFHDAGAYLASLKRLMEKPIETIVNGHPFPPSRKGVLRGTAAKRHIAQSIIAVEELRDKILEALKGSDSPMSLIDT
jgi:glyoxylase-like metal-dependent hydrolase (beta-lactamase superfamily II)